MDCGCERRKERVLDWLENRAESRGDSFDRDQAGTGLSVLVPTIGVTAAVVLLAVVVRTIRTREGET